MAKEATAKTQTGKRNFADILDTPSDEVARPRPMPQGTYLCITKGLPRDDVSTKKGTPFSEYTLMFMEPAQDDDGNNLDVDPDELKLSLTKASGETIPLRERWVRATFFNTEDALWRHKKFLNDLGVPEHDDDGSTMTIRQRIAMSPNRQVFVHIKHTPSEDGETMYANVDKTIKVS